MTEINPACEMRHAELDRRLGALEQQQSARDERLYSRVNTIAEGQAALKATVAGMGETLRGVATDLKDLKDSSTGRVIEDKNKGQGTLLAIILSLVSVVVTVLMFALGTLR